MKIKKESSPHQHTLTTESLVQNFVSKYASKVFVSKYASKIFVSKICYLSMKKAVQSMSGLWFLLACPSCTDAVSGNAESEIRAASQHLELLPVTNVLHDCRKSKSS